MAGQIAVVTGASSGIGRAIAEALSEQGVRLCLVGRKSETLEGIGQPSTRIKCYQADLADDDDLRRLATCIRQDCGQVDILVHSAGVCRLGDLADAPIGDLDWQYRVNVRAPYGLTQALCPLIRSCRGQVVFINSSVGMNARGGVSQYAATKHALKAIADSLREEVNPDGVRVLSVFIGRTASPMQAAVHAAEMRPYHPETLLQPEDVASVILHALSLPRTAEVTDISVRPLLKPNERV
ncbi:MAG: SDR family NAD(P)-dependent oxidoreductase [Nitrospiraceae bacterium]